MKKIFALLLVFMLFAFSGCTNKPNYELVEMTNEQKVLTMQEMEMPEYEGLTISIEIGLENKNEITEKSFFKASSYTNLKSDASYLEYMDAEFDVNMPEMNMVGTAELFIKGDKAYLATDASSKNAAATVTYEAKEVMTMPETFIAADIISILNDLTMSSSETPTAEELEDMASFLNVMNIYKDKDKTKLEIVITKEVILSLISNFGFPSQDDQSPQSTPSFPDGLDILPDMGNPLLIYMLLSSLGEDTKITIVINIDDNVMTSMSIEATLSIVNDQTNMSGSLSFNMDLNGKAPKVPKDSALEEYAPVVSFSIIESANGQG